jgi:hypothetical protein
MPRNQTLCLPLLLGRLHLPRLGLKIGEVAGCLRRNVSPQFLTTTTVAKLRNFAMVLPMPTIKDSQGFYRLPDSVEQLIPLLLPRLSQQKLGQLMAVLADRPPQSLAPEDLGFLTEREAAVILAAIELGRIAWAKPAQAGTIIDSPEASCQALLPLLRGKQTEHFVVLFLNIKNRLMDSKVLSIPPDGYSRIGGKVVNLRLKQ